jgi:hypothetical protein
VVSLACNAEHRFHRGCIAQWANDQGALICPVCRANHGPWPVSVHTGYGQVADIGWGALRRFGRGIAWGFNSVGITAEGWLRAMEEGVDP